jgi:16S rRNA (cytosine967-C5)-methyltransferase
VSPVSPRDCALDVLETAASTRHAFADAALHTCLAGAGFPQSDRAFVTELVYGAVRRRLTLDWLIEHFAQRPVEKVDAALRLILHLALYQLLFMDTVPDYAAVNEAVETAKRRLHAGAAKFANGLLRAVLRARSSLPYPARNDDLVEHLAVVHSHPRWLVRRWIDHLGPERAEAVCLVDNQPPPIVLRANRLSVSRDDLIDHLRAEGVEAGPVEHDDAAVHIAAPPRPLDALDAFVRGEFYVQDVTPMRVTRLLDPKPGERVLDLCAAPGGKTTHCAELMDDAGRVVACDLDENRLKIIEQNVARLGITCVETARCDARHVPQLIPPGTFDRVLLDVPCSNTGVLRRRVEARWRLGEGDIASLTERQAELLDAAALMLKPGGVLVYSTCSIEPEENDRLVRRFLSRHGQFALDDETLVLPSADGGDGGFMARLSRTP